VAIVAREFQSLQRVAGHGGFVVREAAAEEDRLTRRFMMPVAETIFMFSGQGSQYFQMGRELFEEDGTFRSWMLRLDDTVRRYTGRSVVATLYSEAHSKGDTFDRTLLSHPAIFMVEYSLAQTLQHAIIMPDMVLGASLGSFAAAAVAGFMEVEDALTAVIGQAIALEQCCEPGGMTAVFADPTLFADELFSSRSELAAVNFCSHFVVSARHTELVEVEVGLKKRNIAYQRLAVSFAFHSRWIDQAKASFEPFMRSIQCRQARLPLVCCDQTSIVFRLCDDYLWNVVRHPVRFRETIARLEQGGPRRYIDLGPGGTLATFLKYGMSPTSKSTVHAILTHFGPVRRNLAALGI
jgi:bacillaene synthase trans-acting acyltransferase